MEITELTAIELIELLNKGKISPKEVASAYLKRIDALDKKVKSFVHINPDKVLKKAQNLKDGKLKGLPIAIKDNFCVKDQLTTCASNILTGFKPPYSATVIEKLEQEGALVLGKVNMEVNDGCEVL